MWGILACIFMKIQKKVKHEVNKCKVKRYLKENKTAYQVATSVGSGLLIGAALYFLLNDSDN